MSTASELPASLASPREGHNSWAASYDEQPNPVVALQERTLRPLLPDPAGKTVLDLGCGTGRTLRLWEQSHPSRLLGLDFSRPMLEQAHRTSRSLVEADCCELPFANGSVDLVSCCLTLGYVAELNSLVRELARVLTPDGLVFISELHPATTERFGWQRGFSTVSGKLSIQSSAISIDEVLRTFLQAGFEPEILLEPTFAEPERQIFDSAGRTSDFERFREFPAIYILRLRGSGNCAITTASRQLTLSSARVALGPSAAVKASIAVEQDHFVCIGIESEAQPIDLSGYMLLPGLINAHDHLEFGLFPRLGRGSYRNSREWAEDIHLPSESPLAEHLQVAKWVRLWWGGIRNLISGVTTVCHHNPYDENIFNDDFPVRVVQDFSWAHSLHFDRDLVRKHCNTGKDQPFLVHLAEGIDSSSAAEVFTLDRDGALDSRTVIVHGCGLEEEGFSLLEQRGASLVWCPSSNHFLFGQTVAVQKLQSLPHVALGSDSPLTAAGDLLDELRFAHQLGANVEALYEFVTVRPSGVLRLKKGEGSINPPGIADLIAVRDRGVTPAEALPFLSYRNIELVMVGGRIRLISDDLKHRCPSQLTDNLETLVIDDQTRWIDAPVGELLRLSREALGPVITMCGRTLTQ